MSDKTSENKTISFNPHLLKISVNREGLWTKIGFILFSLLALLHVPIIRMGAGSIGAFDVYLVLIVLAMIYRQERIERGMHIKNFSALYTAFLVYVALNFFIYLPVYYKLDYEGYTGLGFVIALLIKQVEYFFIGLAGLYYAQRVDKKLILQMIYVSILFMFVYGAYMVFRGPWHRLGIPFMLGTSSNPAGFVLGVLLMVMIYYITDPKDKQVINRKLLFWIVFVIGYAALVLTASRTNNIAFFFVLFIFLFYRYRKRIFLVFLVIGLIFLISYFLLNVVFLKTSAGGRGFVLQYVLNPEQALQESSFVARLEGMWFVTLDDWQASLFTMFFGLGLGAVKAMDSLYFSVLFNLGIIGFFMYFALFFHLFRNGDYRLKLIVIFMLVNGIGAETTFNSFRTMQISIFYIMFLLYHYPKKGGFLLTPPEKKTIR